MMKVIQDSQNLLPGSTKTVLTVGNFDGIHLGHKFLIQKTVQIAKKENLLSAVVTFKSHSKEILEPTKNLKILSNLDQKIELISQLKPDYLIILEFNQEVANLPARDFVENILIKKYHLNHLIVGEDFALGKNREGNLGFLQNLSKDLDFKLTIIKKFKVDEKTLSSNLIRKLIVENKTEDVEKFLGRKLDT
jgi:riboflavin kinase/FMN adenylyltransferase